MFVGLLGPSGRKALQASALADPIYREMLPVRADAGKALLDWYSKCRKTPTMLTEHPPLTEDSLSRRRSREPSLRLFLPWGPRVAPVFTIYWRTLPAMVRRGLNNILRLAHLYRAIDENELYELFSDLSVMAKKYQDLLFKEWRYYVDICNLKDYVVTLPPDEMEQQVRQWVESVPKHTIYGSEELFYFRFRQGVTHFMAKCPNDLRNYHPLTIKEFCSDPAYWARSGSSTGKRLDVLMDDGTIKKARKQKWATALASTPEEIELQLLQKTKQFNEAFIKREVGKARPVIKGDDATYYKMSYEYHFIEAISHGHPQTTLYMTIQQQFDMWLRMVLNSINVYLIKLPIDQKTFDRQILIKMLLIVYSIHRLFIETFAPDKNRSDLLKVNELITYAIDGGVVRVKLLIKSKDTLKMQLIIVLITILSGLLSGWRGTADLGTKCNAAESYCADSIVTDITGVRDNDEQSVYQGDDVESLTTSFTTGILKLQAYQMMNFIVNPKKNFISDNCDEFLRLVTDGKSIHGYPARAVTSLVWRNPVAREEIRGEERIREMVTSWIKLFTRQKNTNYNMMITDIANSNKTSKQVIMRYLNTPAAVGGLGLGWGPTTDWLTIKRGRYERNWRLASIPPAATLLAKSYHIDPYKIARQWEKNVEGPGTTKITYSGFDIITPQPEYPIPGLLLTNQIPRYTAPLHATIKNDIPPSIRLPLLSQYIEDKAFDNIRAILNDDCTLTFDRLRKNATGHVLKDWLYGRLPFNTPLKVGWSQAALSVLYKPLAIAAWVAVISKHRLTMKHVIRAALTAEEQLGWALQRTEITIGD